MRMLCISDVHGCFNQLESLLNEVKYNPDSDQLILLGDYVDRGIDSKKVVEKVMHLNREYGVVVLKGNHDDMMVKAFRQHEDGLWLNNGGFSTVTSYYGSDVFEDGFSWEEYMNAKRFIVANYNEHIEFLEKLSLYHEDDNHIFVHAGISPEYSDWRTQPEDDFLWIRDEFYKYPTGLDKTVVFGHTPAEYIHKKSEIWFGDDKIGIDCACAYGRKLACLEYFEGEYRCYYV